MTAGRRRLGWGLGAGLAALLGLLVGVGAWIALPVTYTAQAQSYVSLASRSAKEIDPFAASAFILQRMPTYAALATSAGVLQAAATGAGVSEEALAAEVTSTTQPQSVLLDVSVTDDDPDAAVRIATAVITEQARAVVALESAQTATSGAPVEVSVVQRGTLQPKLSRPLALARNAVGGALLGAGLVLAAAVLLRRPPAADHESGDATSDATGSGDVGRTGGGTVVAVEPATPAEADPRPRRAATTVDRP